MEDVELTVDTDRESYAPGDTVEVTLVVRNRGEGTVSLAFRTSQRYDVRIEDGSADEVWRWSADRGFLQVLGDETLEAGEELRWTERFTGALEPGEYTAVGVVTSRPEPLTDRVPFSVR